MKINIFWEFLYAFRNCKLRTFSGNDGLISWTNFSTTHSVNTIGIAVAEKKFSISSIPTTASNSFFLILLRQNVFSFPETLDGIYWLPCQIMSGKTSIIKKTVRLLKLIYNRSFALFSSFLYRTIITAATN